MEKSCHSLSQNKLLQVLIPLCHLIVHFHYSLVSYEKLEEKGTKEGMRVIISSQALYFFEDSPPDLSSLNTIIKLDNLVDCKSTKGKTSMYKEVKLHYKDIPLTICLMSTSF